MTWRATAALAAIPASLLIFGAILRGIVGPVYAGLDLYDYDPAYVYLFNGAGLIEGYTPAHVDHPGTPLQLLSGAVSYLVWLLGGRELPFSAAVFAAPEFFLKATSLTLLSLNAAALLLLGLRVHAATRNLPLALLPQSGLVLLGPLTPRLFHVAPEALVLMSASLAMAVLAPVLFARDTTFSAWRAILLGVVLAIGVTTKVTFLPLIALVLLLPSLREILIAAGALLVVAALLLLPIFSRLGQVYAWLMGILMHEGRYGFGEEGLVDLARVPGRAAQLVLAEPILAIAAIGCLVVIFKRGLIGRAGLVAAVLAAILVAQVAMVLKHFELYYALASFAIAATIVAWSVSQTLGRRTAVALVAFALVVGAAQGAVYAQGLSKRGAARDAQMARLETELARYPEAVIVGGFRARSAGLARQFGLTFANADYAASLVASDPRWRHLERWKGFVLTPEGRQPLSVLNDYLARGVTLFALLPRDLDMPDLVGETLLQLDDERLIRVTAIRAAPLD